ncbi:YegP family protein [Flaviflagellibacter deserti]|jgi:uncharacterized protein|uniref:YegP family protein n=1 Tax=Flaviflagellibacter deserti TaxID=2267266 RepID=A0ABV9Z008_9HYPH
MSKYVVKKNTKGEWRWTFVARNGEKIAMASEGYKSKASCEKSIALLQASASAPIEYDEPKAKAPAAKAKPTAKAKDSAKKVVKAMKSAAEALKPAKKPAKSKA